MAEIILAAIDQKRASGNELIIFFKTPLTYRWLTRFSSMLYGGPQGQYKNISSSTIIYTTVQQYVFQDKKIHSSTTICFSAQQYISQYKNIYSSTERCVFQYRYIFPFWYRTINSSTEIYIRVRKYKFQYRNIFPAPGRGSIISQTSL